MIVKMVDIEIASRCELLLADFAAKWLFSLRDEIGFRTERTASSSIEPGEILPCELSRVSSNSLGFEMSYRNGHT